MSQINFTELIQVWDKLAQERPGLSGLVLPHRYAPPQGYVNPKLHALFMCAHLGGNAPGQTIDKSMVDYMLLDWKLCENGVPTIFVARDFLDDLMQTDVPGDFKLADFLWPHEAMMFVLPLEFQLRYFGRPVPFVRIGRLDVGRRPAPACVEKVIPQDRALGISSEFGDSGVIMTATVFFPDEKGISGVHERGVDYTASFPMQRALTDIVKDTNFTDYGFASNASLAPPDLKAEWRNLATPEEDMEIVNKFTTVTLQLLLALNAMPEHLDKPEQLRKEKVKVHRDGRREVEKEALWKPRLFGGNYVAERRPPQGGTHASPRVHRRKGHRRFYRDPVTRTILRWVWIKPTWVGKQLVQETTN